jgi:coenzyme F420-0:L-glutamate ligase / coenzyme F420-1:gamma-L-glutamate ligase
MTTQKNQTIRLGRKRAAFLRAARIAHLATAGKRGQPLVVPICYVFDGKNLYSPIDEKPKRTPPRQLKRLQNIRENSQVAVVADRYEENWRRLAYVLIRGTAKILTRGTRHARAVRLLRRKYPQYRQMAIFERPMIVITPKQLKVWGDL